MNGAEKIENETSRNLSINETLWHGILLILSAKFLIPLVLTLILA